MKPHVMCVQVNGECVESSYPILPYGVKVEAETNGNRTDMLPEGVNSWKVLVKLDNEEVSR